MRARTLLVAGVMLAALGPPMSSQAVPTAAGFTVTIEVPDTYVPGEPLPVSGQLTVAVGLPIILEVGEGIPDEEIVIRVDGARAAVAVTDDDGFYQTQLAFDGLPPTTRSLQAVAFEGELLETSSRTVQTRQDRILIELTVDPASLALEPGADAPLTATAMWDDGRESDVTPQVEWTSSDESVAVVTEDGRVEAVGPGDTTITATLRDKQASSSVTVG